MSDLKNSFDAEATDRHIRAISGRGHFLGLPTPFTFSALSVYEAGGNLRGLTEKYMIQAGFLTEKAELSEDGRTLLELHRQRGDRTSLWADEMVAAAKRAPKLVHAA